MKVVICGAGRVGNGIARRLSEERHDVVLVDSNAELVDQVSSELDVRGVVGHAAYPDVLERAGVADCEMIIAVTQFDEVNMVVCEVAHALFSVPTKIARIRAQAYLDARWKNLFTREAIPIDLIISPEVAVGEAILERFRTPGAVYSASFAKAGVQLLGMEITSDSAIVETALDQISDLFPDLPARVVGITRGGDVHAPRSNDRLAPGDRAYIMAKRDSLDRVSELFMPSQGPVRLVVIVGGGNIGLFVAEHLEKEKGIRVRLIERNDAQAEIAVRRLKRTIVIKGDGLDKEILEEAGVSKADAVISLTNDDKVNLLISSLAKKLGDANTMALINETALSGLQKDLKVDAILDPRALTVSQILLRMRKGRILSLQSLENGKAEVAEGLILDASSLKGKTIDYDDLPEGITAAALLREDEILFPNNNIIVRADDRVVLFYEGTQTKQVEQYFRVSPDFF